MLLTACSSSSNSSSYNRSSYNGDSAKSSVFSYDIANEVVMGKWARSCALCHIRGEANAPVVGDSKEWQRRLAQGEETILQRVIYGYKAMPPLGYCMSCEESDFRAMIAFMVGENMAETSR